MECVLGTQTGGQALASEPNDVEPVCLGQRGLGPGPWVLQASSGAERLPGAPGSLGPVLGAGPVPGNPPGAQLCPPGTAPTSSKPLRLLAWSQMGRGGRGEDAACSPGTVPPPVPALGTTLTQPEEPYLAPAPPPGCPVTAEGSLLLWPGPPRPPLLPTPVATAKRPAPPHAF